VLNALSRGYRLIDTAAAYGNEDEVAEAIRQSGVSREELFITTKLWTADHGYDEARRAFERSAEALDVEYVDLYLIHWPGGGRITQTWKALVELYEQGRCRSIGVSNFGINNVEQILESSDIVPAINQIEFNVFTFPRRLLQFCRANTIQVEAYSPLMRGRRMDDPRIRYVASKYAKTPAQVMLRWVLQHGVAAIPKTSREKRLEENADIFDFIISDEDMHMLNSLG
jgi:diketogulonate reductase-like aldo/keto reductase